MCSYEGIKRPKGKEEIPRAAIAVCDPALPHVSFLCGTSELEALSSLGLPHLHGSGACLKEAGSSGEDKPREKPIDPGPTCGRGE